MDNLEQIRSLRAKLVHLDQLAIDFPLGCTAANIAALREEFERELVKLEGQRMLPNAR
jgi:hypothetical protein